MTASFPVTLPRGNAIAYAVLEPQGTPTAVVSIYVGSNRIAARVIRPHDWTSRPMQRFGLVVTSPRARAATVQVRTAARSHAGFVRTRVDRAVAPAGLVTPWLGDAARSGQWSLRRRPSAIRGVWLDPRFAGVSVAGRSSQYEAILEALHCFGRVCGLAFRQVRKSDAIVRFHGGTASEVDSHSRAWNSSAWGIAPYGSAYLAIHPNRRDVWIGDRQKPSMGGGSLSCINATRFVLNAYCQLLGWGVYHDDRSWPWAAANANFSYPILFPNNNHGDCDGGLAGMDRYEIRKLQAQFGVPWLRRFG